MKPTFVFVPFFGGRKKSLSRHFKMIESWGFEWRFVELNFNALKMLAHPFSSRTEKFGMNAVWADQIEIALNSIPGDKIVYSFSNPTGGAIEAIARRNASDVKALIADGGPTGEIHQSMMSYFSIEKPVPSWPLKFAASLVSSYLLEPDLKNFCQKDLAQFPKDFPILSIRGWKDPIITPRQIDLIFEPHRHLQWQKLSLPDGQHLNGLRDFQTDYEAGVQKFLKNIIS